VKIVRSLLVVALFGFSASVAFADGIDPLVGIRSGGGSTPITVNTPNPTFNLVVVQDPGDGSICSIKGDTCAVVPAGQPGAGALPVFQNQTAGALTTLTIFIANGSIPLIFSCNSDETSIFTACGTTLVAGGTDVTFSGGSVPTAFIADDDPDDAACLILGPSGSGCDDDFNLALGEFSVDIEGVFATDPIPTDLPVGTQLQGSVITAPEPGSALMLLFGMMAFALTKVTRRAA